MTTTEIRCVRHGRKVSIRSHSLARAPVIAHLDDRPCGSEQFTVTITDHKVIGKEEIVAEILAEEARDGV